MFSVSKALAGVALAATAFTAQAAYLDGQTVSYTYRFSDFSSIYSGPHNAVVGSGVEYGFISTPGDDNGTVDVSDASVLIKLTEFFVPGAWLSAPFNGFNIDLPSSLAALTNVTFGDGTSAAYQNGATISFSDHSFSVNWQGLPIDNSQAVVLNLTTAVPEPETYAMLLAGLGVLGFIGKRRRKAN